MSYCVIRTLRRIAGDLKTIHDYDDVEGLVISLELASQEIAQEHLVGLD